MTSPADVYLAKLLNTIGKLPRYIKVMRDDGLLDEADLLEIHLAQSMRRLEWRRAMDAAKTERERAEIAMRLLGKPLDDPRPDVESSGG